MLQVNTAKQISNLPFFFVLGRPRSGTTLLRTLLDVHPNVNIPLENSGMIHLHFKFRHVKNWNETQIKELFYDFKNLNFIESWNIDWSTLEDILQQVSKSELKFHELMRFFYFSYQSAFGKETIQLLGDKSPLNSLYAREMFKIFPKAKFIHLVRDYRANLSSMRKHDVFSPSTSGILMQWKKSGQQIRKLSQNYPQQFMEIRYEDLVTEPEESYKKICTFLEIEYLPKLLDPNYRKQAEGKVYNNNFLTSWQPDLYDAISTSNIEKWKNEMPFSAQQVAEYIAGETGKLYQYMPSAKVLNPLNRVLTEIKKLLFHLNEMNRFIYDRLPYTLKNKIKNRKFILSHSLIKLYRKHIEN